MIKVKGRLKVTIINMKKISLQYLVFFQFILLLNIQWIIDLLHLPEMVIHILSVNVLFVLGYTLAKKRKIGTYGGLIKIIVAAYIVLICIGWWINGLPVARAVWALPKTLFLLLFFVICVTEVTEDSCDRILHLLMMYVPVNFFLSIFQFVVLGLRNDWVGGIFGMRQGANAYTNIYMCIVCTHAIIQYFNKSYKLKKMVSVIVSCLMVAVMAEITAFYVELALIVMCVILFTKVSSIKIALAVCAIILIPIFIYTYFYFNPSRLQYIGSLKQIISYLGGQDGDVYSETGQYIGGAYSVSRLNPFGQINDKFFGNNILLHLFGMGLGNCEMSPTNAIFQSPFYLENKSYVYYYFSHAFIYLETGWLGVSCYVLIFLNGIICSLKNRRKNNYDYLYTLCGTLIGVFLLFYNSSVRSFSGYFMFFFIAITYIKKRRKVMR